ncbi:hypothetical protein ABFV99_25645 [Cytobacillus horneckiae]|uniref:hypothetical protein n=1 Tax=Cytobacillus horneckiae TaxID=549687 RepID=UPI0034CFC6E9
MDEEYKLAYVYNQNYEFLYSVPIFRKSNEDGTLDDYKLPSSATWIPVPQPNFNPSFSVGSGTWYNQGSTE